MPFNAEPHPDHRLIVTRLTGSITDEELLAYYTSRFEDHSIGRGLRELVDARNLEYFQVTPDGQDRLVQLFQPHEAVLDGVRWAFLATGPFSYGMFRMFEAQSGAIPLEIDVFKTPEGAALWLDVPVDILDGTPVWSDTGI